MDKFLIRKDVYDELIEKGYGKRDLSKLTKKQITDKNGHKRTVYVRNGEQPAEVKQSKTQEGLSETKRAKYEEMLEKVKAGPDENALIVRGKTLNKEEAIAHLSKKLGIKENTQSEKQKSSADNSDSKFGSEIENQRYKEGKEGWGDVKEELLPNIKKKVEEKLNYYRNYDPYKMIGKKTGLNAAQKKAVELNIAQNKENIAFYTGQLEGINEKMASEVKSNKEELEIEPMKTFEEAIKSYNFTEEKKNRFAKQEITKFYPELKDAFNEYEDAFSAASKAKDRLNINPNNEEYKENFKNAVNELARKNAAYEKQAEKALEKAPSIPKPSLDQYMKAKQTVEKMKNAYQKQLDEYNVGNIFRDNGASSILDPMYGLKPNDYTKDTDFINAQMIMRAYEEK